MRFLHVFKRACDNNGVAEGAAMRLIAFFMKKTAAAALQKAFSWKQNRRENASKREF